MENIFILDGARTIVGSPHKSLKKYSAAHLTASVIKALVKRNRIKKNLISEVIIGNTVSAGLGQNFARQAALSAGLKHDVLAYTVGNVCGAGLQAVIIAGQAIGLDDSKIIIAGGAESATKAPYLIKRKNFNSERPNKSVDSVMHDGLYCQMTKRNMGELVEGLAKKYRISRLSQDQYSLESHRKARLAQSMGIFKNEIILLVNEKGKKVAQDDRPRENITMETFKFLPGSFQKKGSVTSGNSSTPSDGAAAVILVSGHIVEKLKLRPKVRIVGYSTIGVDPAKTFESTSLVINNCLRKYNLTIKDIDLFEISEAFAAQMVLLKKKLKISDEQLNVYGGDVAFGHPLGAAGSRMLVTLVHALDQQKKKRGVVCVSYGGGGSIAIMVERFS